MLCRCFFLLVSGSPVRKTSGRLSRDCLVENQGVLWSTNVFDYSNFRTFPEFLKICPKMFPFFFGWWEWRHFSTNTGRTKTISTTFRPEASSGLFPTWWSLRAKRRGNRPFAQLLSGLETGHPAAAGPSPAYDFSVFDERNAVFLVSVLDCFGCFSSGLDHLNSRWNI